MMVGWGDEPSFWGCSWMLDAWPLMFFNESGSIWNEAWNIGPFQRDMCPTTCWFRSKHAESLESSCHLFQSLDHIGAAIANILWEHGDGCFKDLWFS